MQNVLVNAHPPLMPLCASYEFRAVLFLPLFLRPQLVNIPRLPHCCDDNRQHGAARPDEERLREPGARERFPAANGGIGA